MSIFYTQSDQFKGSPVGVGFSANGKNYITHTRLPFKESAFQTLVGWQKLAIFASIFIILFGLFVDIKFTLIIFITVLTFIYFLDLLFSLYVLTKSIDNPPELKFSSKEITNLDESTLGIYSILCPLYKEAKVLPQFVESIKKIDWPKEKLDVLLLLEEDDKETISCAQQLNLPSYIKVLVVPDSMPKTKPKACNYGLAYAQGEYVVVYDAEDRPDPLQLKKAYLAFNKLPQNTVCLQSKLNYYNPNQNLITKLFTAEYSLWFDIILPGFQSINTAIPLGGTSNHFKTNILKHLNGWDPFNVTEDCDLGVRLFKKGYKTSIIDSTTYEEANSKLKSWIRQRSRWIKGYFQTYLVHSRNPINFIKNHGYHALIFNLIIGIRTVFIIINPILWLTTLSYYLFNSQIGSAIEALYPAPTYYVAVFCLVFGNFMYFYIYMIGCAKRKRWDLVKYVFFVPIYWIFASVAAVLAFYQLIVKPHFWEKTEHGLFLAKEKYPKTGIRFSFDLGNLVSKGTNLIPIRLTRQAFFIFTRSIADVLGLLEKIKFGTPREGKLRILIFNWRDTKHVWGGGAEVYIQALAKRWVANGHKVTIFCGWDGISGRNDKIDGVRIIRRGGFYTVYPLALLYYIFKFKRKFDIVLDCENGIPFFTPIFVGVPKILLVHHIHQEVFRKYLIFPFSHIAMFLESKLMPSVYKNIPLVTISNSSKNDIKDLGWMGDGVIDVISPGIDLGGFKQIPKTTFPSFIYLGRLMPWKNVDLLIRAFSNISHKYPSARLTIAGFGESLSMLKELARKLEIEDKISFPGRVDEAEKTNLFAQSWVAVQPSSFEGWGITVIEANACGTPVIASDINGLRDSVIDQRTGILFPLKDEQKLTLAMDGMITNQILRNYMSQEAILWARCFIWEFSAQKFERIFDEIVTNTKFVPAYQFQES